MICFTIPGEAVAQGRPRFTRQGGFSRAYDPPKSRDYKARVADVAEEYRPPELITGPVAMKILIYKSIPTSWPQKKKALALSDGLRPTTKPDVDNVAKGIKDALKMIIWRDDSQVVRLEVEKWYSNDARVEVEIEEVGKGLFGNG